MSTFKKEFLLNLVQVYCVINWVMFELSVFSGFAVLPDFYVELISEFKIVEFLSLGFCGQSLVQLWPSGFGHVVLLRMF